MVRVYVIADIHGRVDLLRALLVAIREDATQHPNASCTLITLGDYIDRGSDSRAVVDQLLDPPLPSFARHYLKGNHEDMLLKFLEDPQETGPHWIRNGGDATLMSYGIASETAWDRKNFSGWFELRQAFLHRLPQEHRRFFRSLRLCYQTQDYFFVHAGVRPDITLREQTAEDLLWIRDDFLNDSQDFGKIIVHGHTIVKKPEIKHNRIALDTGAVYTGKLTCLVLQDQSPYFLQAEVLSDA